MKLLIIGPRSVENNQIVAEAKKRGHKVLRAPLHEISLIIKGNGMRAFWRGKKLEKFDICLFRGISPNFAKAKTLARWFKFSGTEVVDRKLYNREYEFDKMFMSFEFFQKNLPCLDTFHFSTFEEMSRYLTKIPRPTLIKDIRGMHSRNIYSFKTKQGLERFFAKRKNQVERFLIQQKVEADYYFRVLVVGHKALGAMRRMSYYNPKKNKTPLSRRSAPSVLTNELKGLALRAARATNTDIAGVDIIKDGNSYKLLEVNRSPKFMRFSAVMKVNVAEAIVKYLANFSNKKSGL